MMNCLFCDQHICEWSGVDRGAIGCPFHPDYDDEEDEYERNNRLEYEAEQEEIVMEEDRAIEMVHKKRSMT